MTDSPKGEEDEPRPPPTVGSADSSTDLNDIHEAPTAPPAEPSSAVFVPLGTASDAKLDEAKAAPQPKDSTSPVGLDAASHGNPFDPASLPHPPAAEDEASSGTGLFGGDRAPGHTDDAHAQSSDALPLIAAPPAGGSTAPAAAPEAPSAARPADGQFSMLLLTWASLATLTAIYLWWTRPDYPSNLDTIPDDDALQSLRATRGKVSPLSALDHRLVVRLNETRRLGHLEVTPLAVEHRRVTVMTADGQAAYEPSVLCLRLRVKNAGGDQPFAPFDPGFTSLQGRSTTPRGRNATRVGGKIVFEDGYTYTFAHPVGDAASIDKRILPLAIEYARKERVAEQEFPVLQPGESAEVVVLSQEDALPKLKGPMLWRVKLRKGRTAKGTGAAVVVGVPFTKEDVAMLVPPPENRLEG